MRSSLSLIHTQSNTSLRHECVSVCACSVSHHITHPCTTLFIIHITSDNVDFPYKNSWIKMEMPLEISRQARHPHAMHILDTHYASVYTTACVYGTFYSYIRTINGKLIRKKALCLNSGSLSSVCLMLSHSLSPSQFPHSISRYHSIFLVFSLVVFVSVLLLLLYG